MPEQRENDEIQRRLEEVEAREREVDKREKALKAKGIRHNLYERIDVSVKTMNIVIIACIVAILVLVAVGAYMAQK